MNKKDDCNPVYLIAKGIMGREAEKRLILKEVRKYFKDTTITDLEKKSILKIIKKVQ